MQIITESMAGYDVQSADPLLNQRVQQFDFVGLASQFEAALAADPMLTLWQLAPYLGSFSLGGSSTQAIGGDMAYLYGKNGNLDGLSETELRAQLNDTQFGVSAQTLTKIGGNNPFTDVDFIHGDRLTYTATLADGSPLPSWLSFDAAIQTFSGTPDQSAVGNLQVSVIATDTGGLSATNNFMLTVTGDVLINTAPLAAPDFVNISEDAGQTTIAVADLLANDLDPDTGDILSVVVFDAATAQGNGVTQDFTGDLVLDIGNHYQTLGAGQIATDSFTYTISDAAGANASATVNVTIAGENDAPVLTMPVAAQQTDEDALFSFTLPAGTFTDIDNGDVLSYAATLPDGTVLPAWLTFDAATQTFSGTPLNEHVGNLNILVAATDAGGLSVSGTFALNVMNVNDAPVAVNDVVITSEDMAAQMTPATLLANDTDPDAGDTFALGGFSAISTNGHAVTQDVAGNLVLDIGNHYQSLAAGQAATDSFTYTLTDAAGAISSATVNITINGLNDAPVTQDDLASLFEDATLAASGNVLANDADADQGAVLTIASAGSFAGNYGSLLLNADGGYSYVLSNASVQSLGAGQAVTDTFIYQATDGSAVTPAMLSVTIHGENDAPVLVTPVAAQQTDEDALFSFTLPAGTFTDIDNGDVLSYAATLPDGTVLPAWLTFDAATQTFSGTPLNEHVGNLNILVTATDTGGLSVSSTFALNVINVNDAPIANADTGAATEDGGIVTLTAATLLANDIDPDFIRGDALNIVSVSQAASGATVTLINGNVQYNPGTLYQSLTQGQTTTDIFTYTVSDQAGATSTASVTMTITGVNDAPVTIADSNAVREDLVLSASGNVLTNDSDVDQGTLLMAANAGVIAGQYGSLTLSANGNYSYTLNNTSLAVQSLGRAQSVLERFAYSVTDGLVSTPSVLTITLAGNNDAPTLATLIADQIVVEDTAFSFTLPANTFADIDVGDTQTLSATLADGGALPAWLVFNAATRAFSGISPYNGLGTLNVRVSATDQGNATISDDFALTIAVHPEQVITGTAGADTLVGSKYANRINGLAGNDTLTGNMRNDLLDGGLGSDTMAGGAGDDIYVVDAATDVVTEGVGAGIDTVQSCITLTLATNVENLTLTGIVAINGTGNILNNMLIGNSANNTLTGGAGNDTLDGAAGIDTLVGGTGDDIYIIGTGDIVTEGINEGNDTARSSITYTLATNVENLILTGTSAINGTGNTLCNNLAGNSANNTLTGGTGADTLTGGTGMDIFVFAAGDTVLTLGGTGNAGTIAGFDTITDFTLGIGGDTINTVGASTVVANATVNGTNSTLTIAGQTVKSHRITSDMITFDDLDIFASALTLTSTTDVAAVVQYLQANDIGNMGSTVAFTASIGGTAHTYLFTQGDNTGTNNLDVLVDMVGTTALGVSTLATTNYVLIV